MPRCNSSCSRCTCFFLPLLTFPFNLALVTSTLSRLTCFCRCCFGGGGDQKEKGDRSSGERKKTKTRKRKEESLDMIALGTQLLPAHSTLKTNRCHRASPCSTTEGLATNVSSPCRHHHHHHHHQPRPAMDRETASIQSQLRFSLDPAFNSPFHVCRESSFSDVPQTHCILISEGYTTRSFKPRPDFSLSPISASYVLRHSNRGPFLFPFPFPFPLHSPQPNPIPHATTHPTNRPPLHLPSAARRPSSSLPPVVSFEEPLLQLQRPG